MLDSKYQKELVAEILTDGKEIVEYKQLAALVASKLEQCTDTQLFLKQLGLFSGSVLFGQVDYLYKAHIIHLLFRCFLDLTEFIPEQILAFVELLEELVRNEQFDLQDDEQMFCFDVL